jgi:hypothetical protein
MRQASILTRGTLLLCMSYQAAIAADPARGSWRQWFGLRGDHHLKDQQQQHVLTDASRSRPEALWGDNPPAGYIALGDSYSAGIGTGVDGKEDDCRQGLHAYPLLILEDLAASHDVNSSFQWMSCTGAIVTDVLSGGGTPSQIEALNRSMPIDLATLSIGGNDLGFFDVMNACIFRFYSFYSGTCEAALERAQAAVDGPEFEQRLHLALLQVLDAAAWEKKPDFSVTVTGYARFFDADTSDCDNRSMAVWWQSAPKLTRELRARVNGLVAAANDKLRRTIDAVNAEFTRPRAIFVDYDDAFDGHRFCEEGVTEPDYTREDTWFFLVAGADSGENGTAPDFPNGTLPVPPEPTGVAFGAKTLPAFSPLTDPEVCLERAERSGDWGELAICYMAMAKHRDPSLRPSYDRVWAENGMWYVPTSYGKCFHPVSQPFLDSAARVLTSSSISDQKAMKPSETRFTRYGRRMELGTAKPRRVCDEH